MNCCFSPLPRQSQMSRQPGSHPTVKANSNWLFTKHYKCAASIFYMQMLDVKFEFLMVVFLKNWVKLIEHFNGSGLTKNNKTSFVCIYCILRICFIYLYDKIIFEPQTSSNSTKKKYSTIYWVEHEVLKQFGIIKFSSVLLKSIFLTQIKWNP